MSPAIRKFALAIHLTVSVGWLGALAAYLSLDVTAATSVDGQKLRSAYLGMDLIASVVIVPLAIATLVTGIAMCLGTKWGLFRHYWVLISFILTTVAAAVLIIETRTINYFAEIAGSSSATAQELRALGSTLVHSIGGTVILLVILVLNLYKPQGMTPYGWRKQRATDSGRSPSSKSL